MDINKLRVLRSRKRKHDTKTRQFRQVATVYPYHMNVDVETITYPDQPMAEENNRPYWPVISTVYNTGSLPKRLPSATSTSRPNGNSSSINEPVNRCRCLNNGQRMPYNDRPEINEIPANNASNNQIPIITLDDDPVPNNNCTMEAARTNRSNNGADGETAEQEAKKANRERTGCEDAEDAFGRSIALMLKKIRNISDRLKIQAKIYETLSQQLKQR